MKVVFINEFGNNEVKVMDCIPRIGDTVPLFYRPYPVVTGVMWFPELVDESFQDADVVITLK